MEEKLGEFIEGLDQKSKCRKEGKRKGWWEKSSLKYVIISLPFPFTN